MLEIKGSKTNETSSEKLFDTWKEAKDSKGYSFGIGAALEVLSAWLLCSSVGTGVNLLIFIQYIQTFR